MVDTATFRALGPRLEAVCAAVPPGSRVADIAADHGRVAEALRASGRAVRCIATELRRARIAALAERVRSGLAPAGVEIRIGDGLEPLDPGDLVDVVVLAGLGGRTIVGILRRGLAGLPLRRLVLQPQSEHARLRSWLRERSWDLVDERVVRDAQRFYVVLVAEKGPATAYRPIPGVDDGDLLEAGPLLLARRDPVARAWWCARAQRLRAVVEQLPEGRGERARADLHRARRVVAALGSGPPEPER